MAQYYAEKQYADIEAEVLTRLTAKLNNLVADKVAYYTLYPSAFEKDVKNLADTSFVYCVPEKYAGKYAYVKNMLVQFTEEQLEELANYERFGKDSIIGLATTVDNVPYVRNVDAYYENGAFYVLTYGLSNKMKQIEMNPTVAISGFWFTAHGKGVNLGYFGKEENKEIASKMREVFSEWIDNGHNNFDDVNTCILRIDLNEGVMLTPDRRYEIDFTK